MRVIDGKDYYDSARAYGSDSDVVLVRSNNTESEPVFHEQLKLPTRYDLKDRLYPRYDAYESRQPGYLRQKWRHGFAPVYVWFVGKLYCGCRHRRWHADRSPLDVKVEYIWDQKAILSMFEMLDLALADGRWNSVWRKDVYLDQSNIKQFGDVRDATADELTFLIDNYISIAISDCGEYPREKCLWKINTDGLKSVGFAKVVDPYQAFQELSMYVGGVLSRPGNPMVEITDDSTKLNKHGFDKWTFRKQSERK